MDKLTEALRSDAARIDVTVSPELDDRIRASLESARPASARPMPRKTGASLWWASGLTGIAATLLLVLVYNVRQPEPPPVLADVPFAAADDSAVETPLLNMESAVFTAPLEEELDNLESDLKKAERRLREELRISF